MRRRVAPALAADNLSSAAGLGDIGPPGVSRMDRSDGRARRRIVRVDRARQLAPTWKANYKLKDAQPALRSNDVLCAPSWEHAARFTLTRRRTHHITYIEKLDFRGSIGYLVGNLHKAFNCDLLKRMLEPLRHFGGCFDPRDCLVGSSNSP